MSVLKGTELGFHHRGMTLVIITLLFSAFATALVVGRVIYRLKSSRKLHADDYVIIVSLIISIGLTTSSCVAVDYGYGDSSAFLSSDDSHISLEAFFALQILYKMTINLTKTSILLLYLRIFAPATATVPYFRRMVYVTLVLVIGYAIASIVATIFQCMPIMRTFDKTVPGTCINLTIFWYANGIANVMGDIAIFLLPMGQISGLHLPRRQKLGVYLVFALGFFVCLTSILRMQTLGASAASADQTYGTLVSTIWTTIEASTAIICACLPMLKAPLAHLFPRLFPRGSRGYPSSHTHGTLLWPSRARAGTPSTAAGSKSSREVDEGAVAMEPNDLPLGTIAKRTDVEVVVGPGGGGGEASAFPSAHLVGPDYGVV